MSKVCNMESPMNWLHYILLSKFKLFCFNSPCPPLPVIKVTCCCVCCVSAPIGNAPLCSWAQKQWFLSLAWVYYFLQASGSWFAKETFTSSTFIRLTTHLSQWIYLAIEMLENCTGDPYKDQYQPCVLSSGHPEDFWLWYVLSSCLLHSGFPLIFSPSFGQTSVQC